MGAWMWVQFIMGCAIWLPRLGFLTAKKIAGTSSFTRQRCLPDRKFAQAGAEFIKGEHENEKSAL